MNLNLMKYTYKYTGHISDHLGDAFSPKSKFIWIGMHIDWDPIENVVLAMARTHATHAFQMFIHIDLFWNFLLVLLGTGCLTHNILIFF